MVDLLPLSLTNASVRKTGKTILGPVSLTLSGTGTTILLGPNGAGKSSLLRLMHGLDRPASGTVHWAVPHDIAHLHQAFVFQHAILLRRSVLDNIAYPLVAHGMARKPARAVAADWLDRIGLTPHANRPANTLSGGERQKLAMARALIRAPSVLFLDEPCSNLDGQATAEIESLLQEAHTQGTRLIMATHDLGQARRLATDVLFIHKGALLEHGPADRFFATPQTPEAIAFLKGDIVL
ncbi:MAG: ATP-binding cassette domain-containing protein [Pseudopelagicola sp.]|nr:ATP-binding cassette domain-containing protein [Pseudopelagicola sp.]